MKEALKKAQEYALKTGLYLKGNVLEKVVLFTRLQTGTAYRWRLRRAIGYHCREWRKLLRLSAFWHTLKELAPVRQRFFRAYIKKPLINSGFPCGERGKPDLILPKYVRNDITLSMWWLQLFMMSSNVIRLFVISRAWGLAFLTQNQYYLCAEFEIVSKI